MKHLFYPAIFHKAEEGGYWVTFPDFEGVFTQGETMEETFSNCIEALGLEIADKLDNLPKASEPNQISLAGSDTIVLIDFNLEEYKRRVNSHAVKKTLSIPSWLNEEAMAAGINFSALLQKSLKNELGIR